MMMVTVSSAAKSKIQMMMMWLLSKLYGHLVHADGEEDCSGGGDVEEDGGPGLDMSPTVYSLPLMEMMATVLV